MSRLLLPLLPLPPATPSPGTVEMAPWLAAVGAAADPCLVLDGDGRLVAASAAAAALFGRPLAKILGLRLVDDVITLIDFTASAQPGDYYVDRIPPLLVLRSGAPARGLLRIRRDDGSRVTLDAVAAPLRTAAGEIAGSVCFLAGVPVS